MARLSYCKLGLEGIVSKRKDSAYRSGALTRLAQNEERGCTCGDLAPTPQAQKLPIAPMYMVAFVSRGCIVYPALMALRVHWGISRSV